MDLPTLSIEILCGSTLLLAVVILLHIRKEPKDAHGADRK